MRNKMIVVLMIVGAALLTFGAVLAQDATATPVPTDANVEVINTLEDITNDPAAYYGQEVTVEGTVYEFLNIRTVVLGENAALDDDQILVINNSGQEFPLSLTPDRVIRVTGTLYASINEGGVGQFTANAPRNTAEGDMTTADDANMDTVMTVTAEAEGDMTATDETDMNTDMSATDEANMDMDTDLTATDEANTDMDTDMDVDIDMTATPITPDGMGGLHHPDFTTMVLPDNYNDYVILVLDSVETITYVEMR